MSAREAAKQDILDEIGALDMKYLAHNEQYDVRLCHIFSKEQIDFQL